MICRPGAGDLRLSPLSRRYRWCASPPTPQTVRSPGHLVDGVRVTTALLSPLSDAASSFVQRLLGLVKGGWRADTGLARRWRSNAARVAGDSRPWAGRVLSLRRRAARRHVGRTGSRRPLSRVCVWGGHNHVAGRATQQRRRDGRPPRWKGGYRTSRVRTATPSEVGRLLSRPLRARAFPTARALRASLPLPDAGRLRRAGPASCCAEIVGRRRTRVRRS